MGKFFMHVRHALVLYSLFVCCAPVTLAKHDHEDSRASGNASGAVIVAWNQLAYEVAFAEDQFRTFKGQRAIAMVHLAQHDALNSIAARFDPYVFRQETSNANPQVAAAQAARDILVDQYPAAQAQIDALLEQQVSTVASSSRKGLGVKLGHAAAAAILEARRTDGWSVEGVYESVTTPGAYQTTPDWQGFVLHPGLAHAKPFFLDSSSQLRPGPPPALTSRSYARAFQEVKELGEDNSTVRSPDQTGAALWWMEFSEGLVNRLARRLVTEKEPGLWETARLFALLNAALVDSYVGVWDSKYEFNHWRPYTAIREAATDSNPDTRADPNWNSLRPAPPFPEYVSAHAAGCACTFTILAHAFGNRQALTLDSLAAPPGMPTRSFKTFSSAAQECADSRVWLGFHYRYSTEAGAELGRRSAHYALSHFLRPRR